MATGCYESSSSRCALQLLNSCFSCPLQSIPYYLCYLVLGTHIATAESEQVTSRVLQSGSRSRCKLGILGVSMGSATNCGKSIPGVGLAVGEGVLYFFFLLRFCFLFFFFFFFSSLLAASSSDFGALEESPMMISSAKVDLR